MLRKSKRLFITNFRTQWIQCQREHAILRCCTTKYVGPLSHTIALCTPTDTLIPITVRHSCHSSASSLHIERKTMQVRTSGRKLGGLFGINNNSDLHGYQVSSQDPSDIVPGRWPIRWEHIRHLCSSHD